MEEKASLVNPYAFLKIKIQLSIVNFHTLCYNKGKVLPQQMADVFTLESKTLSTTSGPLPPRGQLIFSPS